MELRSALSSRLSGGNVEMRVKIHASVTGDQIKPRCLRYLYATKSAVKRSVDREYGKMASVSVN